MEKLDIESNVDINKDINNNGLELYNKQKKFLETNLGKTINAALDIGIKAALPNLIENQIIDIKNAIFEQGFKDGIKEIINSSLDIGKSTLGVITGNFENISQVQLAVKNGGILDSISALLDMVVNLCKNKGLINNSVANIIKKSKNTIISSISDKLEETLTNQMKAVEKIENYCKNWNIAYGNQDFLNMEKSYKNIETNLNKIVPLENVIKEARTIENIHNLIKNNGKNFNISKDELILAEKLA